MPISRDRIRNPSTAQPPPSPAPPKSVGVKSPIASSAPAAKVAKPAPAPAPPAASQPKTSLTVTAMCGHEVTFTIKAKQDAKVQTAKRREQPCGPCRDAEHKAKQAPAVPKNLDPALDAKIRAQEKKKYVKSSPYPWAEPGNLPADAVMVLRRVGSELWVGECTADGLTVTTEGIGPARQVPWMAGLWLETREKETGNEPTGTPNV